MKYKFELQKYSYLNTEGLENLLNQRAEEGWNLKKVSFEAMLFEKASPEKRKKYVVDYVQGNSERWLDEERKSIKEFYGELGWAYAGNTGGGRGTVIFEAPYERTTKPVYVDAQERRQRIKERLSKGEMAFAAIRALVNIAIVAVVIHQLTKAENGEITLALIAWAVYLGAIWLVGIGTSIASQGLYMARQSDFSIKLADLSNRFFYYAIAVTAVLCLIGNIYLIKTGEFGVLPNIRPSAYFSLAGIPIYCIGKGVMLLGKGNLAQFGGGAMWVIGIFSVLLGFTAIPLQLGWIN